MSTIIYGTYLSPFMRKVLIALEIKKIEYTIHPIVPTFQAGKSPENAPDDWNDISPLNKIPALRDEHVAVSDSSVICDYLDKRYMENPLIPQDHALRARCQWYEEYADTVMTTGMVFNVFAQLILRKLILKTEPDMNLVNTALKEEIPKICEYLERQLESNTYLLGDTLSLADIAVLCPIVNLNLTEHKIDAGRWKNIDAFYQRMMKIPAVAKIVSKEQGIVQGLNK